MTKENTKNVEELLKKLSSANAEEREDAVANLVGITDKNIVPALVKCLLDQHPGVKYFAKKALAAIQKEHGDIAVILKEIEAGKKKANAAENIKQPPTTDSDVTTRVPTPPETSVTADSTVRYSDNVTKKKPAVNLEKETPAELSGSEMPDRPHKQDEKSKAGAEADLKKTDEEQQALAAKNVIDDATRHEINKIQSFIDNFDKSQLSNFLARLKTEENPFLRATLISAVGRLGSRSNAEVLIPFLSDQDTRVVANTVESLENLGNSKCIEPLIKIISHPDNRVRANVVKAIWKFASSNEMACRVIMDKLREMMFSAKPQMRESAIYVLSEIATEEALELLNIALNDKIDAVREKANAALIKAQEIFEKRQAEVKEKEESGDKTENVEPDESEIIPQASAPVSKKSQSAGTVKKTAAAASSAGSKNKPLQPAKLQSKAAADSQSSVSPLLIFLIIILLTACGGAGYWFGYEGRDLDSLIRLVTGENEPVTENGVVSENNNQPAGTSNQPGETSENLISAADKTPSNRSFSVKQRLEEAGGYLKSNFYSEAINEFSRILKKQPDNVEAKEGLLEAQFKRAEAYYNLGFYDKAMQEFGKTIKIDEKDVKFSAKAKELMTKIEKMK